MPRPSRPRPAAPPVALAPVLGRLGWRAPSDGPPRDDGHRPGRRRRVDTARDEQPVRPPAGMHALTTGAADRSGVRGGNECRQRSLDRAGHAIGPPDRQLCGGDPRWWRERRGIDARGEREVVPRRPPCRFGVAGHGGGDPLAKPRATSCSAARSGTRPPSSRRSSGVEAENGMLATTVNGRRGSGMVRRSPATTRTVGRSPNRRCSSRTNTSSRSIARTRAPVAASASVRAPAPNSGTSESGTSAAASTRARATARERRKCTPERWGLLARVERRAKSVEACVSPSRGEGRRVGEHAAPRHNRTRCRDQPDAGSTKGSGSASNARATCGAAQRRRRRWDSRQ